MSWSFKAAGHVAHDDFQAAADIERTLLGHLANVFADARYGISESLFAGQHAAGTPGIPEPEPEPAQPTLSPEAQITALTEQVNELKAQLAAKAGAEGSVEP
jgi:hypothetical protein